MVNDFCSSPCPFFLNVDYLSNLQLGTLKPSILFCSYFYRLQGSIITDAVKGGDNFTPKSYLIHACKSIPTDSATEGFVAT